MKAKRKSIASDRDLDAEIARRVMGWKVVESDGQAEIWGKKQDKAGRWRKTKVPAYSTDLSLIADVEDRIRQLHLLEHYEKELKRTSAYSKLPKPGLLRNRSFERTAICRGAIYCARGVTSGRDESRRYIGFRFLRGRS